MSNARKHVLISGMVQGVFFRSYAQERAQGLGVTGWVKNRWDGKVEAIFEGEKSAVDMMVKWCHEGPPSAHVSDVDAVTENYTGEFDSFNVEF
ncbi:MAG: acylphosphatase [Candidatus Omnitrophota bacterium]